MAALKDIAECCGVSIRTVSRALKGNGYVSQPVREKVLAESRRLGYRPDRAARSLRTRKSFEVAVVAWNVDELHMAKIAGLEQALREADFAVHVLLNQPAGPEAPAGADPICELISLHPAGVALFPRDRTRLRQDVDRFAQAGIPAVAFDAHTPGVDAVRIDRPQGVHEAVLYLAERGYRRIAYLGEPTHESRLQGFYGAMRDLGREPVLIRFGDTSSVWGRAYRAAAPFARLAPRPDAVQAYSDEAALGFLAGLRTQGLRVPEDVAVVGFDDRQAAAWANPPLTTVAQPNLEVGRAAAERLLARMHGDAPPTSEWTRVIPTRLVVREST